MRKTQTLNGVITVEAVLKRERQKAVGRRLGLSGRGKKRTTQAERDEIAAYLARNPEPFRG